MELCVKGSGKLSFRHTILGAQSMLSRVRACFGNLEMVLEEIGIVDVGQSIHR